MEREIKFRAWDVSNKKLYRQVNQIWWMGQSWAKGSEHPLRLEWTDENGFSYWRDFRNDGAILMQYTGLKDKNEKEIYEGDIVDCCRYGNDEMYRVQVDDIRRLPQEMFGSSLNWIEIVGNICEHPELLNKLCKTP